MPQRTTHTNKELLLQIAAGDEAAYKTFFTHYWDQLYSTALTFTKSPELSEDLTQEVFARIWISREKLSEVENFEGYLFIMTRNIFFTSLRKEVYTLQNENYFENYFRDVTSITPDAKTELKEFENLVEQGINNLPPQQQRAFRLSRFQGMTHEQIAEEMGISKLSVKSHIVRAIQSLKKYLENHSESLLIIVWIILFL